MSIIEVVLVDRFSRVPLFHHFYPKTDANAHFNSVFSNTGLFNRKTKNTMRFSVIEIRISVVFMHLRSKPTSEIHQKIRDLDGKTEENRLKVPTLSSFFQKKSVFIEKRNTLVDILF